MNKQNFFKIIFSIGIIFLIVNNLLSQTLTEEKIKDSIINKTPSFSIYKDNYFITGIPTNSTPSKDNSDIKYQISFKQLLFRKTFSLNSYLFLTYTQKAFWDFYRDSSPFKEINFNPGLGIGKPIIRDNHLKGLFIFMVEHESNGRDSIYSRSWNSISLNYITKIGSNTEVSIKGWIPFLYKKDNPDLIEYIGISELKITHQIIPKRLMFDVTLRKGLSWDWKGAIQTQILYNPFKKSNQYLILEWFNGYSESLINYKEHVSMIRFGIVIKSNYFFK